MTIGYGDKKLDFSNSPNLNLKVGTTVEILSLCFAGNMTLEWTCIVEAFGGIRMCTRS